MPEAVIVATGRTPIGRANKGSLVSCRPDDLAALVIKDVLAKVPALDPALVEDVMLGCGQPAGEAGYNVARVAAILAGVDVPGVTVNRYCSSSLQTIRMAAHAIKAGEGDVFVAGGVETVSRFQFGASDTGPHNAAFADAEARTAARGPAVTEPWTEPKGLPDVYIAMGQTAENVAEYEKVTRQEMDEFAARSQQRAVASQHNGFFEREIIPVTLDDGTVVTKDDGPREGTTVEGLAALKPVFREGGTITAGNACPLNDGAAAVVVMSETKASELGITPLARIVASGVSALDPEIMGLGPIEACRQALRRAGKTIDDIDLVEINEAFAAQVIPSAKHLGIDWDKLNVKGGSIALGHPFGMTGARIMTTLLNALEDDNKTWGLESMCVGRRPGHGHDRRAPVLGKLGHTEGEVMSGAIYDVGSMWELVEARAAASPERRHAHRRGGAHRSPSEPSGTGARSSPPGSMPWGCDPTTPVSWQLPTRIETIVLSMALARLGAVQNPIIHIYREREVAFALAPDGCGLLLRPRGVEGLRLRGHGGEDRERARPSPVGGGGLRLAARGRPGHAAPCPGRRRGRRGALDLLHLGHDVGPEGGAPHRHHPRDGRTGPRHGGGADGGRRGLDRLPLRPHRRPRLPRHGARHRLRHGAARGLRARAWRWRCSRRHGVTMAGGSTAFYMAYLNEQRKQPGDEDHPLAARPVGGRRAHAARGLLRGGPGDGRRRWPTATA